ncbi:MAG TPA: polymer-forming cytoskeletal protein [Lentimicrobium sp.]|jgi:cytoskeletal protein CcmA (bactofilin family)|nr:polymer-forming cytoskeletal protein [Lentimicrobium sp.]
MAKNNIPEAPPSANLIQSGTLITGDIESNGNIRIDGTLKGTVIAGGKVILGSTGTVEGEINCINADIEGRVNGLINVKELLSLKSTAVVSGDIYISKLSIEPGARFTGTCRMDGIPAEPSAPVFEKVAIEQ